MTTQLIEEIPAHNIDAERAILGACFLSQRTVWETIQSLDEADFYRPAHRLLFRAIKAVALSNRTVDMITVPEALQSTGCLADVGGEDYILEAVQYVGSPSGSDSYSAIVREKKRLRNWREYADQLRVKTLDGTPEGEILAFHNSAVSRIGVESSGFVNLADIDCTEPERGIPTGLAGIDKAIATKGWPAGQMSIIMAQEKAGKSALALTCFLSALRAGHRCLWVTFADLNAMRIKSRLLRSICGFGNRTSADRSGMLEDYQAAEDELAGSYHDIYDATQSDESIESVLGKIELRHGKRPYDLVVMDYAQKMRSEDVRLSDSYANSGACSTKISRFCERTGIPVVVGSQITEADPKAIRNQPKAKGNRQWTEDCGLALLLTRGEGSSGEIKIVFSRFGGMETRISAIFQEEYLSFREVR